jgi:mRNA-degrading endonuclease toxin of MazEF toxin-antitoxin module
VRSERAPSLVDTYILVASLYPGEAQIRIAKRAARVLGDQLRSIDKARLGKRIGRLNHEELTKVDEALRITLEL